MVLCPGTRKPEWVWNILLVSESNDTFKNVKDRISILKRERGQSKGIVRMSLKNLFVHSFIHSPQNNLLNAQSVACAVLGAVDTVIHKTDTDSEPHKTFCTEKQPLN